MIRVVIHILSIGLLVISGCTFYSGKSLLDDIECTKIDSFQIGFFLYHPNPNQYTQKIDPIIWWRTYYVTNSDHLISYTNSLCTLIIYGKEVKTITNERWLELLREDARKRREDIEAMDSIYSPGGGIALYMNNGEVFGFGRNLISISRIGGTYLGLPLSKGAFSYSTGVYHNDSTLNDFIFDFCNQIIRDKNRELLENSDEDAGMRLDIWGDTANAKPIPLLKYRY